MKRTLATITILLALTGCFNSDDPGPVVTCDDTGCWAAGPSWGAEARALDEDDHQDGIDAGTLELFDLLDDAECYAVRPSGGHVCLVEVEGVTLVGVPLEQVYDAGGPCDDAVGPWDAIVAGNARCLAVFGEVAVEVR